MLKKQAQLDQQTQQVVDSFENKIQDKPMPISSRPYPTGDHSNKNMNKTNPFLDNGGTLKQTGDDQVQGQQGYNDVGGMLPFLASRRQQFRKALFDAQQMPAGMDVPQMGDVTEFNQMNPVNQQLPDQKKRDWQTQQTDRNRALQEFTKDGPQDQIPTGLFDFGPEASNTDLLG